MDNAYDLMPTSILALFETSKEQRKGFVENILAKIEEGSVDPLKIHLQLKCTEDIMKKLVESKEYKDALLEAAKKYGKSFEYQNARIEIKEAGTQYDYSNCGDDEIAQLLLQEKELKEKIKERQKFLQNLPEKGMEVRVGDELVTMFRPSKTSTTTIAVTLK